MRISFTVPNILNSSSFCFCTARLLLDHRSGCSSRTRRRYAARTPAGGAFIGTPKKSWRSRPGCCAMNKLEALCRSAAAAFLPWSRSSLVQSMLPARVAKVTRRSGAHENGLCPFEPRTRWFSHALEVLRDSSQTQVLNLDQNQKQLGGDL